MNWESKASKALCAHSEAFGLFQVSRKERKASETLASFASACPLVGVAVQFASAYSFFFASPLFLSSG